MFQAPLRSRALTITHQSVHPAASLLLSPRGSTTRTTRNGASLDKQLAVYLQNQHLSRSTGSPYSNRNMAFLLPGLRRGLMLSTPLILSTPLLAYQYRHRQQIRCDGPDPLTKITNDLTKNYTSDAQTPIITQSGAANPRAIRQISMGSILGVIGGLGISVFSKPLAILIGLGIFVLQVSFWSARLSGFAHGKWRLGDHETAKW